MRIFITTHNNQKFKIAFAELDINQIVYDKRPDDWYEQRHEGWTYVLNRLKQSIQQDGLTYPLCILYRGTHECTHGGQRYWACKQLGMETVPCIISYPEQYWDDIAFPLIDVDQIHALNHQDVEKMHLTNNDFHILVKNRKHWDPNDYQKANTRIH